MWQQDDDGDDENLQTGVSGLSSMWPTNPYNMSHLCSGIYKVLLPFLRNKTETFLPVKDLSVDSTQSYV